MNRIYQNFESKVKKINVGRTAAAIMAALVLTVGTGFDVQAGVVNDQYLQIKNDEGNTVFGAYEDGSVQTAGNVTVGGTLVAGNGTFSVSGDTMTANASHINKNQYVGGNQYVEGTLTIRDINVADAIGQNKQAIDTNAIAIQQNSQAIDTNTIAIRQNSQAIGALDSRVGNLDNRVDDLDNEIDNVGAISAALAGLHPLDYDGTGSKFQLSAAVGSYDSSQAAAIGAFYHFNRDVMISLGGATAFDGDHKTAGNLGVTFRIGAGASGEHVSDDVMARLEAMDRKITALEQENQQLKGVLGAIDMTMSKDFPDVPANHWAYDAVSKLAGNGVVAGYPDGEFHGDRTMTRYEMAEIIYKAMSKGAQVDQKLVDEFKPEMEQVAANQNA